MGVLGIGRADRDGGSHWDDGIDFLGFFDFYFFAVPQRACRTYSAVVQQHVQTPVFPTKYQKKWLIENKVRVGTRLFKAINNVLADPRRLNISLWIQ